MGTIAEKLNYSLEAKELIKDGINYLGGNVTDETTLKEYRDELDSVYNKLPKVSNSTASDNVILYPTLKGRIDSTLKGQIGQDTTEGRNKFNNDDTPIILGSNTIQKIDTGIRVTATASSTGQFVIYKLIDLNDYIGKDVRMKADFVASSENLASIKIGVCSADGSTRQSKASTSVSGTTVNFTVPSELGDNKYLAVWLYSNSDGTAVAGDYVDYTKIIVTINNADMTYEEYTGGIASPNPNYEQPVKCVTGENTVRVKSPQLIDFASKTVKGYSFENDTLVYESSKTGYANVNWGVTNLIKKNPGKELYFSYESIDVSNQIGNIVQLIIMYNDGTANSYIALLNHNLNHPSYTIPNDTSNISYVNFGIYSNNSTNNTDDYSVTIVKPQLQFGETELPYSEYGTPQEKELDLGELELYENGYFSRENGKWYLNNEYETFKFNNAITNFSDLGTYIRVSITTTVSSTSSPQESYSNVAPYKANYSSEDNHHYINNNVWFWFIRKSDIGETINNTTILNYINSLSEIPYIVYRLATPSKTEITNQTLINQLNEIYKLMSYDGTTIIETECEEGNMPIIISASALLDSAKVIEDLETRIEVLESEE